MQENVRLIDANALKEFIANCRVCDICPNKKLYCALNCDFPDTLTPLWEKVIDSIPTIDFSQKNTSYCGNDASWCESCVSKGKCDTTKEDSTNEDIKFTGEDIKFAIDESFKLGYEMAKAKFERPQGHWINQGQGAKYPCECSECHTEPFCNDEGYVLSDFCPNCGVDMRGAENE